MGFGGGGVFWIFFLNLVADINIFFFLSYTQIIAKQKQRGICQAGLQLPAKMEFPSHRREQSHDPEPQRQFW